MQAGKPCQEGFTLLAALCALALLAIATHSVVMIGSHQAQRSREAELLRIGGAYVDAIASYYESSPGSIKSYPSKLDELLDDQRFVGTRRHLRQRYADPLTGSEWILIRAPDGLIRGVHSSSQGVPVRTAPISLPHVRLEGAATYSGWRFVYDPAAHGQPRS